MGKSPVSALQAVKIKADSDSSKAVHHKGTKAATCQSLETPLDLVPLAGLRVFDIYLVVGPWLSSGSCRPTSSRDPDLTDDLGSHRSAISLPGDSLDPNPASVLDMQSLVIAPPCRLSPQAPLRWG